MAQSSSTSHTNLQNQILDFCKHVAGPFKITAICQSDDYAIEAPTAKSAIEVLLILRDFPPRLMNYVRIINDRNVVIFCVDQWVFERDVDRGFLGEGLASLLVFPYAALKNQDYFHQQEVTLKKRLVQELLENLILSYPELSYNIRIKPEFFMYEVVKNLVRIFPPMAYGATDFLCGEANKDKVELVLRGYLAALKQLQNEGIIIISDDYLTISENFIQASKKPKVRFANIFRNAPRALFTSMFSAFPQLLNFLTQNAEAFFQFQTPPWRRELSLSRNFVDPRKYVLIPTSRGVVSLADKLDIRTYTKQVLKGGEYTKIKVEEFGGVLNDVYLIKAYGDQKEKRILVKRFRNFSSMKWFPLSMWSIGARTFALLGKSRLEREAAINELLCKAGFLVPKILHLSTDEGLIFMEFIEGESLTNALKRIAVATNSEKSVKDLALVTQLGETYAKVHDLNVVLGDTKPDNVIVDRQGRLYLLDFEQASRNGDRSWDVACFLYYCGHYLPLDSEEKAQEVTKAFIRGYLNGGGSAEVIKCAAITKYTRVFSIFTLPSILRVMSNTCKQIEGPKCKKR